MKWLVIWTNVQTFLTSYRFFAQWRAEVYSKKLHQGWDGHSSSHCRTVKICINLNDFHAIPCRAWFLRKHRASHISFWQVWGVFGGQSWVALIANPRRSLPSELLKRVLLLRHGKPFQHYRRRRERRRCRLCRRFVEIIFSKVGCCTDCCEWRNRCAYTSWGG